MGGVPSIRYWRFAHKLHQIPFYEPTIFWLFTAMAWVWRRLMWRTTFIGITGSVGKTTAKDCLAAVLASHAPTAKTIGSANGGTGVPRAIFRVRPWHRYAVIEVAAYEPGRMRPTARALRPQLAVLLNIEASHRLAFPDNEAIVREKIELAKAVPAGGQVLLGYDCPLLRREASSLTVPLAFFAKASAELPASCRFRYSAEDPGWPEHLLFHPEDLAEPTPVRPPVQTKFLGAHWGASFMAAYSVARLLHLPHDLIASALTRVEPFKARMQETKLPNDITLIRDDFKNDPAPFSAAVAFLRRARATRKVVVIGASSDTGMPSRQGFRHMARELHGAADLYVFVGTDSDCGAKVLHGLGVPESASLSFPTFSTARNALPALLRPQDLVLLKGRSSAKLGRLYWSQLGSVSCELNQCSLTGLCDTCPKLGFRPFAQ